MSESVQKKLLRIRPPRVRITYDVETGGAIEKTELPFIVGILADLKGEREDAEHYPSLKERSMIEIDRDNFDDVMKAIEPRAAYQVENKLSEDGGKFAVDLKFRSLDDFDPDQVVNQIEPLRRLIEARSKLADLRNKMAGNDKLEDLLSEVLSNTQQLEALAKQSGEADGKPDDGKNSGE